MLVDNSHRHHHICAQEERKNNNNSNNYNNLYYIKFFKEQQDWTLLLGEQPEAATFMHVKIKYRINFPNIHYSLIYVQKKNYCRNQPKIYKMESVGVLYI